jgi:hypothetical protein
MLLHCQARSARRAKKEAEPEQALGVLIGFLSWCVPIGSQWCC